MMDGLEQAQRLLRPPEKAQERRKQGVKVYPFRGTGRREVTPSRPIRHGKVKWWRGEIHVEGVTLSVVASPCGISLPANVTLDDGLYERVEAYLTGEAEKLNRRARRGGGR